MADEEVKKKTPELETLLGEIFGLVFLAYLIGKLLEKFTLNGSGGGFSGFLARFGLDSALESVRLAFVFFSNTVSILFVIGITYALVKIGRAEQEFRARLYPGPGYVAGGAPKNERWERVLAHINSDNPSDWRLAILECDIILDELLDSVGLIGNTMSEKLKMANKNDFKTLDNAWEAHKIRNAIAHEGQDFVLTKREARRIVGLYESVFREFDYI